MKQWQRWTFAAALGLALTGPAAWAAPPPWAPAHGYRRKRAVVYEPAPFVYSGVTYLPLRSVASLIGAALLWDSLHERAVITYNGRETGLVVGSPRVYYGSEVVVLPRAPLVVREVVYVPAVFCEHYLRVPVRHSHGTVVLSGPHGEHEFRLVSSPPGRVSFGKAGRRHAASARERGRGRARGHQGASAGDRGRADHAKQQGRRRAHGRPERAAERSHAGAKARRGEPRGGGGNKGHGRGR